MNKNKDTILNVRYDGEYKISSELLEAHVLHINKFINEYNKKFKENIKGEFYFGEGSLIATLAIGVTSSMIANKLVPVVDTIAKTIFQKIKSSINNSKKLEKKILEKGLPSKKGPKSNNENDETIIIYWDDDSIEIETWIFEINISKKYDSSRRKYYKSLANDERNVTWEIDGEEEIICFSVDESNKLSDISFEKIFKETEETSEEKFKNENIIFKEERQDAPNANGRYSKLMFRDKKIEKISFSEEALEYDVKLFEENAGQSVIVANFTLFSTKNKNEEMMHEIYVDKIITICKNQHALNSARQTELFNYDDVK